MRIADSSLVNTADIEAWPASLLRARGNADARLLARSSHVLRAKDDGRYLAALLPGGALLSLTASSRPAGGGATRDASAMRAAHDAAIAQAARAVRGYRGPFATHDLPLHGLHARLARLDIDADAYSAQTGLSNVAEPARLQLAGRDRYRRPLWLHADAARGWHRLRAAALADDVLLDAISGYRSHAYQLGIFATKLARGIAIDDILQVNAAPGFSEHHGGRALDIGTPGEPAAMESFESTPAFAWLQRNAAGHGWTMSYPRGNPHGIVFEPWHWRFN